MRQEGATLNAPVAVGDVLPDVPHFLEPGLHVAVALEATYQATWDVFPEELHELLTGFAN